MTSVLEATSACYQPEQQRLDDNRYLCRHLELPCDIQVPVLQRLQRQ